MVNLPIELSDKPVTPFGGMSLMKRFVDSLGIRDKLRELPLPQGQSNRAYDPVHVVESFWLSIWTGASRFIHADWLRYDTVLQEIFGFFLALNACPRRAPTAVFLVSFPICVIPNYFQNSIAG